MSASCKGQLVNATKQDSFERLGQCVVFHINRTKWDSQGKRKVGDTNRDITQGGD